MLFKLTQTSGLQQCQQFLIGRGDTIVIKATSYGAKHRHSIGHLVPGLAIALHLLTHISIGVFAAFAIKLIDNRQFGIIQHINFFQLTLGTKLWGHYIDRHIHIGHNARIALANTRGFNHHQIKATQAHSADNIGQRLWHLTRSPSGANRAHIDIGRIDRIHTNAVTQ